MFLLDYRIINKMIWKSKVNTSQNAIILTIGFKPWIIIIRLWMIKSIVSCNQYIITLCCPYLIGYWSEEVHVYGTNPLKSLQWFTDMAECKSKSCIISFGRHNTFPCLNVTTTSTCASGAVLCWYSMADLTAGAHCIAIEWGLGDGRVIVKRHGRQINIWIH